FCAARRAVSGPRRHQDFARRYGAENPQGRWRRSEKFRRSELYPGDGGVGFYQAALQEIVWALRVIEWAKFSKKYCSSRYSPLKKGGWGDFLLETIFQAMKNPS